MKHLFTICALLALSNAMGQTPEYVPTSGLVSWWNLNGDAIDEVGGNDGIQFGTSPTSNRQGQEGQALGFDGDDYVSLDTFFGGAQMTEASYSLWFNSTNNGGTQYVSGKEGFWRTIYVLLTSDGVIRFGGTSGGVYFGVSTEEDAFEFGTWNHLVVNFIDSQITLFLNGAEVISGPSSTSFLDYQFYAAGNSTATNYFGAIHPVSAGITNHFVGSLDEFGLWNRALDEEEVSALYLASTSIQGCTDLWACNYNPEATDDDDSCEYLSCVGCLNSLACNYDSNATLAGSCDFPDEGCEECVNGVVIAIDIDNDGVADCDELDGCTDPAACNFMPAATEDDGSCVMQPQEIWQGEQLFSLEEELALAVSGVDHVIWSDNTTENPLTVVGSGTYGFTMVNGDLNQMSQSFSTGPGSCGVVEAGSDWKADQFTVGLWLKLDNANRGYILMEGDDGWLDDFGLALQCIDGFIELDVNHLNLGLTSVNLNDGNWHAVHVMYNGSAIQLHIDGVLNMDVPFEDTIDQNDWPFVLGSKKSYECTTDDGSGSVFEGSLSRLSIWSRTLEPWELMESITCGERFVGESLVGHWPLHGSGASDELVALAGEAGVNHDMAVVEDSPVGSCSRCATSDWVEVVLATDLCGEGTVWDASAMTCVVANPSDTDFDGCVSMTDLLDLLTVFGTCAETESEPELDEWSCGDLLEYQGYDYSTVQIGEQCWFQENLRSEAYANGDMIQSAGSAEEFAQLSEGAKVVYGEWEDTCSHDEELFNACNPSEALEAYGYLYNWHTTSDDRGLCPSGWSVPSQEDWDGLFSHFGGNAVAGEAMKTSEGWAFDGGGSNVAGFDAVPGSQRNTANATWESAGAYGFWWSSTSTSPDGAWGFKVSCFVDNVYDSVTPKSVARSIRCLQDAE